jgi:hypothetical protein
VTYHTTALAQNCSRLLKILFDHEFLKKPAVSKFWGQRKYDGSTYNVNLEVELSVH